MIMIYMLRKVKAENLVKPSCSECRGQLMDERGMGAIPTEQKSSGCDRTRVSLPFSVLAGQHAYERFRKPPCSKEGSVSQHGF
jgi:hypothetical protein